jgi:hypothetical protein
VHIRSTLYNVQWQLLLLFGNGKSSQPKWPIIQNHDNNLIEYSRNYKSSVMILVIDILTGCIALYNDTVNFSNSGWLKHFVYYMSYESWRAKVRINELTVVWIYNKYINWKKVNHKRNDVDYPHTKIKSGKILIIGRLNRNVR